MSGVQWESGDNESVWPVASQLMWYASSGATARDAATLAWSIGLENSMLKGEPRPKSDTMFACAVAGLGPYVGAALAETPFEGSPTRSPAATKAVASPSAKTFVRVERWTRAVR